MVEGTATGGGLSPSSGLMYCLFSWSGKFYICQEKVREFQTPLYGCSNHGLSPAPTPPSRHTHTLSLENDCGGGRHVQGKSIYHSYKPQWTVLTRSRKESRILFKRQLHVPKWETFAYHFNGRETETFSSSLRLHVSYLLNNLGQHCGWHLWK